MFLSLPEQIRLRKRIRLLKSIDGPGQRGKCRSLTPRKSLAWWAPLYFIFAIMWWLLIIAMQIPSGGARLPGWIMLPGISTYAARYFWGTVFALGRNPSFLSNPEWELNWWLNLFLGFWLRTGRQYLNSQARWQEANRLPVYFSSMMGDTEFMDEWSDNGSRMLEWMIRNSHLGFSMTFGIPGRMDRCLRNYVFSGFKRSHKKKLSLFIPVPMGIEIKGSAGSLVYQLASMAHLLRDGKPLRRWRARKKGPGISPDSASGGTLLPGEHPDTKGCARNKLQYLHCSLYPSGL